MASTKSVAAALTDLDRQKPLALEYFLDHIHDAVITLDREWRFVYLNQAALPLCNRPGVEMRGRVMWDVFPRAIGSTFQAELHRVAAERRHRKFEQHDDLVDRWMEVDAYPAEDGVIVILRDITEARKAEIVVRDREAALRASEDRFRAIFSQAAVGIAQLGIDGKFVLLNDPVLRDAWVHPG